MKEWIKFFYLKIRFGIGRAPTAIKLNWLKFKDLVLAVALMIATIPVEIILRLMHWTSEARIRTALGSKYSEIARYLHYKHTGKDPLAETLDKIEKSGHKKFRR